nr:hypothetical protein CFP56_30146 [Quercus suber]
MSIIVSKLSAYATKGFTPLACGQADGSVDLLPHMSTPGLEDCGDGQAVVAKSRIGGDNAACVRASARCSRNGLAEAAIEGSPI